MGSSGLSRVSQNLTHSRRGIKWLEPAAGAIPEAQWFPCFSLGSQCGSPCSPAHCGSCWVPAGFVNGHFLSEKGVGHFQNHGGDTSCCSTLMLLPWSALTDSSRWGTWEMLMPRVVQKNPGSQGCYPQGSNNCHAEVHRSDLLFPGATDDQPLHSLCKTVTLLQVILLASLPKWKCLSRVGNLNVCHNLRKRSRSNAEVLYHPLNPLTFAIVS